MPANYSHSRNLNDNLTDIVYNIDHLNHVDFFNSAGIDDYSASVAQMQTMTDPGEIGTESLATSLAGELERLRFAVRDTFSVTGQWYSAPQQTLEKYRSSCLIKKITQQTIQTGISTAVTFDNIVYDDLGFFNISNPTRITVPSGIFQLRLFANIRFTDSVGGAEITISKNGSFNYIVRQVMEWIGNTTGENNTFSPWFNVVQGDYFELFISQNSGAARVIDTIRTWFSIEASP